MTASLYYQIRKFLTPPVFQDDEDKTRIARLLYPILTIFLVATTIILLLTLALFGIPTASNEAFTSVGSLSFIISSLTLFSLARGGRVQLAGALLVGALWMITTSWLFISSAIASGFTIIIYPLIIALAGLLVSARAAVLTSLASIGAIVTIVYIHNAADPEISTDFFSLVIVTMSLILTGLLLHYAVNNTKESLERAHRNETALAERNQELQDIRVALEKRNEALDIMVKKYVDCMAEVAQGNLSIRLITEPHMSGDDPLVVLGQRLNETISSLQEMITKIRQAANKLGSAASEIMAATGQQASGAKAQAAAIAETTSTIDEVRAIAEQSSQHAQSVADLAQRTADTSQHGQQVVSDTVNDTQEMRSQVESIASDILALSEQTQAIGEIIASVNEIASQSHMLALNAAVEAARAGEAGSGFAVVAGEVRRLAEQSRAATEQIRQILSDIQHGVNAAVLTTEQGSKQADAGMRLAQQAGESIQHLTQSVRESVQSAVQITAAANQQLTGIQKIGQAMDNIHQVSMQNEAGADQVRRAAQDLNNVANQLQELVEQYQL